MTEAALPILRAMRRRSTGVLVPVTAAAAVLAVLAVSWLDPIDHARPRLCAAVSGPCGSPAATSRGVA